MALRTDDGQPARFFYTRPELDIRSTTCHIGCDRYGSRLSGFLHDLSFTLVQFCIQYVMLDASELEHPTQQLRDLHGSSTYQHRAACCHTFAHLIDHGIVFFTGGLEYEILMILTLDRAVGWNYNDIQLIDVP